MSFPFTPLLMKRIFDTLYNDKSDNVIHLTRKRNSDYIDEFCIEDLRGKSLAVCYDEKSNRRAICFEATVLFDNNTKQKVCMTIFQRYSGNREEFWTSASLTENEVYKPLFITGALSIAGKNDVRPRFLMNLFFKGVAVPEEQCKHEYNFYYIESDSPPNIVKVVLNNPINHELID